MKAKLPVSATKPLFLLSLTLSAHCFLEPSKAAPLNDNENEPHTPAIIRGNVTGYTLKNNDDLLDGSFVFASLSARSLLSFQIDNLFAPSEKLKAGPIETEVPGNMHFPTQREWYGIFPLTIQKNLFSVPLQKVPQEDEFFALWFRAPFSKLIDLSRKKAPYRDFLKLIEFKAFGLSEKKDWSTEKSLNIALTHKPSAGVKYHWNRSPPTSSQWDSHVAFQKTKHNRWIVADFKTNPSPHSQTLSVSGLESDFRLLLLRVQDKPDNKKPQSMVAHFVESQGENVSATGTPAPIENVNFSNNKITWAPIFNQNGWMAILRGEDSLKAEAPENGSELGLDIFGNFGFSNLLSLLQPLQQWVSPSLGFYELDTPLLKNETLALLFVKTAEEIPDPSLDDNSGDQDPLIFQHAQEIKIHLIQ